MRDSSSKAQHSSRGLPGHRSCRAHPRKRWITTLSKQAGTRECRGGKLPRSVNELERRGLSARLCDWEDFGGSAAA